MRIAQPGAVRQDRTGVYKRLLTLLFTLILLVVPTGAGAEWLHPDRADPCVRPYNAPLASHVKVEVQEADPKFPNTVDFVLRLKEYAAKRAILNYRPVGRQITSEQEAEIKTPAPGTDIKVTLDLSTHYMPPGVEVEYYWTLFDAAGGTTDTAVKTFKLLDERYSWQTLTDAQNGVSVHWYAVRFQEGGSPFGKRLLDTSSQALDRLEREIGASLDRPADIWVYATQEELASALFEFNPEWVGAQAFPDLGLILAAIADDEAAEDETSRLLPHELSHLVLYQATRNPYNSPPTWLDEGIAVHNQEVRYPDEEAVLREAASEGRLVPLKALSSPFGADEETSLLSYAQAGSVIDFVVEDKRYGPQKLSRTISAFREGVTYDEALQAGLGVTVDELDEHWRDSLPYEVVAPAAPQSTQPSSNRQTFTWSNSPLVLVPLFVCALMVLAGGILTVVMLARRRTA